MQMEENAPTTQETSENERKGEEIPEVHAQTVSRVTKSKNPQKVAAGKKGAAIRKQKQEAALSQLREAKNQLKNQSYHTKEENTYTEEKAAKPACHSATSGIWYALITALVLIGGGVAYLQLQTNNKKNNNKITSTVKEPTQVMKEPLLNKQDPFIMQ